ncbi:MAG: arginine repressor, partial [Gemmatimonadota bacterium]|nr:arginine repressor [Gemmatimonadota bacterium]
GWDVTQSTLSRDLREMRVGRVPTSDGAVRYSSPDAVSEDTSPGVERILAPLFKSVDGVGELIVLNTLPGGAQAVAEAMDTERWPDIVGTLAGDNTVLIICRSGAARERVTRQLHRLAGR